MSASSVVFPAPDWPMIATRLPASIRSDTSRSTVSGSGVAAIPDGDRGDVDVGTGHARGTVPFGSDRRTAACLHASGDERRRISRTAIQIATTPQTIAHTVRIAVV